MPTVNPQTSFLPGGSLGFMDASGRLLCTEEPNTKNSYRACCVTQTFYSTAAAVLFEMTGSATMTIRIKKILMWANCATKFYAELTLGRATAVSAGSPNAITPGKMDKTAPAATATVQNYTAAATSGTGFAAQDARILGIAPPAAGMIAQPCEWDWCLNNDGPMILRGTGDVLEIYNNTTALGAGTYGCMVHWEEDNS